MFRFSHLLQAALFALCLFCAQPSSAATTTLSVSGTADPAANGADSGVTLTSGSPVKISASGTWTWQPGSSIGPEGSSFVDGLPEPTVPGVGLMGRLGTSGRWFLIGSGPTLVSGSGRLYLAANDNRTDDNGGSLSVTIEDTTKDVQITSGPLASPSTMASSSPTARFTFTGTSGSTFECSTNSGGSWTACTSPYTRTYTTGTGAGTFRVRATSGVEQVVAIAPLWTVSSGVSAPSAPAISGTDGTHYTSDPTFTFTSSGNTGFDCSIDSGAASSCSGGSTTVSLSSLSTGSHTLTVTAYDASGNASTSSRTFSKDAAPTVGPATNVAVVLSPSSIIANGTSTSTATATVTDADGNALSGQTVTFTTNAGQQIGSTTAGPSGTYSATITSTTTVGTATITATDSTPTTPVTGTATLTQTRGPATSVAVVLSPSTIIANGISTSTATITVTDAQSHPASGDTVTLGTSGGQTISSVSAGANPGTYTATITSTTTVGTSTITATDTTPTTPVSGTATLTQRAKDAAGPPTVTINSPATGGTYNQGQVVATSFTCTAYAGTSTTSAGGAIDGCTDSNHGSGSSGTLDTATAGTRTYTVTAHSADGQSATASISYTVLGPPVVVITKPTEGAIYKKGTLLTPAFSCHDATGAPGISSCRDSNNSASFAPANLDTRTPGTYTYSVTATSSDGQSTTRSVTYKISGGPTITVTSPDANRVYPAGQDITIGYSCTDETGSTVTSCVMQQQSPRATYASGDRVRAPRAGSRTLTVTATNALDQTTTKHVNLIVADPPIASFELSARPSGGSYPTGADVRMTPVCRDSTYGPGIASCIDGTGRPATATKLDTVTRGKHSYSLTATSLDGQTRTAEFTWFVADPPIVTLGTPTVDGKAVAADKGTPTNRIVVANGAKVSVPFTCAEGTGGTGLLNCSDDANRPSPGTLDTVTPGDKAFTVSGVSNDGLGTAKSLYFSVGAAPFKPKLTASILQAKLKQAITFTAAGVGGWAPYTYAWDLTGSGTYTPGTETQSTSFATEGDYTVGVRVTDSKGNAQNVTVSIHAEKDCRKSLVVVGQQVTADCMTPVAGSTTQFETSGPVQINGLQFNTKQLTITPDSGTTNGSISLTKPTVTVCDFGASCTSTISIALGDMVWNATTRAGAPSAPLGFYADLPANFRMWGMETSGQIALAFGTEASGRFARIGMNVKLPTPISSTPVNTNYAPGPVQGGADTVQLQGATPIVAPMSLRYDSGGLRYDSPWSEYGASGAKVTVSNAYVGKIPLRDVCFSPVPSGTPGGCPAASGSQRAYNAGGCPVITVGSSRLWNGRANVAVPGMPSGLSLPMFGTAAGGRIVQLGGGFDGISLSSFISVGTVDAELCTAGAPQLKGKVTAGSVGGFKIPREATFRYDDPYTADAKSITALSCTVVDIIGSFAGRPRLNCASMPWRIALTTNAGIKIASGVTIPGTITVSYSDSGVAEAYGTFASTFGPISVDGSVSGWLNLRNAEFAVSGSASLAVDIEIGTFRASGDFALSDKGVGACIKANLFGADLSVGARYLWPSTPKIGCGFSDVVAGRPASRAVGGAYPVSVGEGEKAVLIRAVGQNGPPKLVITPPDGSAAIASPADANHAEVDGRYGLVEHPEDNSTAVMLVNPAAGDWKVASADPNHPLVHVEYAYHAPEPSVTGAVAKVRGGTARMVQIRYVKRSSDNLSLVERGGGFGQVIRKRVRGARCADRATVEGAPVMCATVPFRPVFGPGGTREVHALLTDSDGLAVKNFVVARFKAAAPAKPTRPRLVQIRRLSHRRLAVTWTRSRHAKTYNIAVRLSDGRRLVVAHSRHCRAVVLRHIDPNLGVAVTVTGIRRDMVSGPKASIRLPADTRSGGRRGAVRGPHC